MCSTRTAIYLPIVSRLFFARTENERHYDFHSGIIIVALSYCKRFVYTTYIFEPTRREN